MVKIGRNDLCPCGSGKKYKKCCLQNPILPLSNKEITNPFDSQSLPEPHLHLVKSVVWKGYRWRAIWNRLHYRPIQETFHEFIIEMLKSTFGEEWRKQQMKAPENNRHMLVKWVESYRKWKEINRTEENREESNLWSAGPSGEVMALLQFAYDMYCLQVVNKLPDFLVERLKDRAKFQGARYEVGIAAIIARSGLDITFLDDVSKNEKHCEFIASHKASGERIGVEAKSRHRKGVLHQKGSFDPIGDVRPGIKDLLRKALKQKPENLPYLVFVDLNLPPTPDIPAEQKPWLKDIMVMVDGFGIPSEDKPDKFNALIVTNFSYYYGGNTGQAPVGEYLFILPKFSETPIKSPDILSEVLTNVEKYSHIPREV